jgi:hypothetical protein
MKLKVFSDRRSLPDGMEHAAVWYPVWGSNPESCLGQFNAVTDRGEFSRFRSGKRVIKISFD